MNILSRDQQVEIIATLCEGVGQRAVSRLTGADRKTVARLALAIGRGCEELHDRMMVGLRVHRIECDELWAYVGHKRNPQLCTPTTDGNIQIVGSGVITAHEAAVLIVEIAKAAIEAHRRSGRYLPDRRQAQAAFPYIEPEIIGLTPSEPTPDYLLLNLHFGELEVGIAMTKSAATQIAQALIAAGSGDTTAH